MLQTRLNELRCVDINSVDKEMLTDASSLILDADVPQSQRLKQVLTKTQNPYCFRMGDMAVKLEFADSAPTLQNCLYDLLRRKKSGL